MHSHQLAGIEFSTGGDLLTSSDDTGVPPPPPVRDADRSCVQHAAVPRWWWMREFWPRELCFKPLGDGGFECQLPTSEGQRGTCQAIVKEPFNQCSTLRQHLETVHHMPPNPAAIDRMSQPWQTGLFQCFADQSSCLDCWLYPCCFIARLESATLIHSSHDSTPYIAHFRNVPTKGSCAEQGLSTAVYFSVQPLLWLLFPITLVYDFAFGQERMMTCLPGSAAVLRAKKQCHVRESDAATKCKVLFCCPFALCQAYREVRTFGINPGLTCSRRPPAEEDEQQFRLAQHPRLVPRLEAILPISSSPSSFG
jgi:Cys-rich protein (TIGR01571 family)